MGTLTSLMDLSTNALLADQTALGVTSNNVANQNTVGYTQEVVNWQAIDVVSIGGTLTSEVTTATPVSQRDRVLEQRVQQQTQVQAQSATINSGLQQLENIFGLSSTATSASTTALGSATDSFFSSLAYLTSNPSDTATRQNVLSTATTLASAFNSASGQISQISSTLDQQVANLVTQVNSLSATVAALNGQISSVSGGKDAGIFEDQRQAAIAQLSQYIGLDQVATDHNGITLTTSNGLVLVGGNVSYPLSTTQIAGIAHVLAGPNQQDITSNLNGGQLGGFLTVRSQYLPQVSSALDALAYGIANQVNIQNAQGTDGNGSPGQALFSLGSGPTGAAASIAVTATSPFEIAAAASGQGSSGNTNAQALADLATSKIVGGTTAASFYASLLSQIGSNTASATADSTVQQATLIQLTMQRDSLSGVSLNQEAANLTQYQRSYEAAAKVFSIVDAIMASALNLGEQSTVA